MITFKQYIKEAEQAEPLRQYVDRLTNELGVKLLGNGINSFVFEHPTLSHVAVKIFMDDDQGYQEYLDFCMKHPSNVYVSKILETEEFSEERKSKYITPLELHSNWNVERGDNPPYSIAFIERLQPLDNSAFSALIERLGRMSGVEDVTSMPKLGGAGWEVLAEQTSDSDLQEFAKFLVAVMKRGHKLDLGNRKNFMMRGQQVVFIDPLF